ncbi:M20 family metallopeptidase, partial [Streptomyces sp. SID8455]|nr:M20 family metallopeptidase [Streptomyces sp. SID8455]
GDRDGALKTARKGSSRYEVTVHGRAAHAGLDPEKGVNAAVEAAHQVLAIAGIGAAVAGGAGSTGVPGGTGATGVAGDSAATGGGAGTSTVTPTLLSAGSTPNTVPARARIAVDVRVPTSAAQDHIDTLLRGLTPRTPGARLEIQNI